MTPTIKPTKKQELAWEKWMDDTTKFIVFGGGAGGGKAQTLDSKIYTPTGYTLMGDIKVGDTILSAGRKTKVTHIHPQGEKQIYKVTFQDGAITRVTGEHLWDCWVSSKKGRRKVRTTEEIMKMKSKVIIPLGVAEFDRQEVSVDPYVLGALLGDAGLTKHLTFTSDDDFIVQRLKDKLPNFFIRKTRHQQYSITQLARTSQGYMKNDVLNSLRDYGLFPIKCDERFVPEVYKYNSKEVRRELLSGLIDTDGYVDSRGHISFTSKSNKLAKDVQFMVRSLGGRATLKKVHKTCGNTGVTGTYYTVYIQIKDSQNIVSLPRKVDRLTKFNGGVSEVGRRIVSIEKDGVEKAQCITVSDPSHLYLTDDFILTHNSWVGCEMLLTACYFYPGSSWFMARNELKRLMNTTYKTWTKVCKHHGIPEGDWKLDGQYNVIKFKNGSEVHLLDVAHKPTDPMYERFGSYEFTGGFGDEINEWEFDAYDVLKSRIGRNNHFETDDGEIELPPKFFGACNPAKNWVYQEFYKPWRDGTLSKDKAFIQSLFSDNPHTAKSYGEQLASIKNSINRQRLMEGVWEYTDDIAALTTYTALSDMFTNPEQTTGTKYAVFDVARGGNDKAVANLFDGWHSYKRIELPKTDDPQELREEVRSILVEEKIAYKNAIYDDNGVGWALGGGELKGMRQFVGSRSALPSKEQIKIRSRKRFDPDGQNPNYANLKSQCGYYVADKINQHATSSADGDDRDVIIEDLTALLVEKYPEKEAKLQLVSKEDIKDNLGRSPDYGDTYIMRSWFDLYEQTEKGDPEEGERVKEFYDRLRYSKQRRTKPKAGLR